MMAVGVGVLCAQQPPVVSNQMPKPEAAAPEIIETEIIQEVPVPEEAEKQSMPVPEQPQLPDEQMMKPIEPVSQKRKSDSQEAPVVTKKKKKTTPTNANPLPSSEPVEPEETRMQEKQESDSAGKPLSPLQQLTFDVAKKRKDVIALVERGAKTLQTETLETACRFFSHTKEYIDGDLYLFVYDMKGVLLAHGEDSSLIWKNLIDLTDWVGTPIVKELLKKARSGGGWVTYGWHNATKVSYVQLVTKNGVSYAIGSGYFPQSKEEAVVNLVKGGVALFNEVKKSGQPADWAFSRLSYPSGRFVAGNLYLYALDFLGNIVAQGERPGLIGTNSWDYRDSKGKYTNREIVQKLETSVEGVWTDYVSKRAVKRTYAEKVVDSAGKKYFIACGYYPDADRDQVEDLVRKGYQFMKTSGKTSAIEMFSHRLNDDYRYGDLVLVVYDLQGKVVTHGGNIDSIGTRMWDARDEDNTLYIQQMIKGATKEGSWTNAKIKGSFESTFAQKIDLGLESFIIACSYYPVSKTETLMLLVQSAASYLRDNPRETAFAAFTKPDGSFRRGDLQTFVIDIDGLCYVYGDDSNLIWRNIISLVDEDGRPFIKLFINKVERGADFVSIKLNRATKVNYLAPINKGNKNYIVGSGYYQ